MELLGPLKGLGLLKLSHVLYPGLLTGSSMLVFFTTLSLMGFYIRYLVLFLLFSVIDSFKWFLVGSFNKNIQLILEFKAPSLVPHFPYCTLMTFLMMLYVIFLFMLTILLSNPSVIGHLICGNNLNWLLKLHLIYEILWIRAASGLLISMPKKLS